MNKKILFILILIVFIASVLRLWQIGNVPPSPDWDEVSLGYNAYSIMNTGKDEYGKFLPIIFRSFDDYKPALYSYIDIPFIKLFDLNIASVRLPSAIFGILTVVATFFLIKELFKRNDFALISSFLLAISPWHIQFSRVAFESNVGLAFNVFAILFFVMGLRKPRFIIISFLCMALNIYVYQSDKVFTPLLAILLILIFRKQFLQIPKKYIITGVIMGLLIAMPIISFTLTNKEALARAKGVSVFSDITPLLFNDAKKLIVDKENNDLLGIILDNRRVVFVKSIAAGYLSHFDLNWLFITGDLSRHHAPNMGLLYIFELPFLLLGVYSLIFGDYEKKTKMLIFAWLLIAPIPASITSGVPSAVRTLNFLPTFQILTAIGIVVAFLAILNVKYKMFNIKIKYLILALFLLFSIFNFSYYLNQYFVQLNYYTSIDWQYGYKEAVLQVQKIENRYDKIVVSNKPYLDQSYIFFLFYLKYSPKVYQKEAVYSSGGFRENHKFGKYEFRPIEWSKEIKDPKILYVGMPSEFQSTSRIIKTINFLNGILAISLVEG